MSKIPEETLKILIPMVKQFEGTELKAYRCPAGVVTIGVGFTGKIPPECADIGTEVKMGMTITQEQADRLLVVSLPKYYADALKWSPNLANASPSRQAAIIDFCYNCGGGNYHISSLLKDVIAENWKSASQNILKWNKAGGKVLKGLVRRREAESKLLLQA